MNENGKFIILGHYNSRKGYKSPNDFESKW